MVSEEVDNRQLPPTIAHLYLGDYFEGALEIKDEYSFRMAETMMESIANTLGVEQNDKNTIKILNKWEPRKIE